MLRAPRFRLFVAACLLAAAVTYPLVACCPAPRLNQWAVNADQTVIMIWDPSAKRQHFIRQANFETDDKDFGFLIPSPSQPELAESGNEAFQTLKDITAPRHVAMPARETGGGCACSKVETAKGAAAKPDVRVLEEKLVAGFNAAVLEADDADVLVTWLKDHGYAFSPAIAEWAKPYVEQGWKITALKVAPPAPAEGPEGTPTDAETTKTVKAGALRLSFDTERPLFPYREPDYAKVAGDNVEHQKKLARAQRLLRIYFLSNARFQGDLTPEQPWTGRAVWAGKVPEHLRTHLLTQLQLPADTGPAEFHLTEFEDRWPYKVAPADVYFAAAQDQEDVRRPDVYVYQESSGDVSVAILFAVACVPLLLRRKK